MIRRIVAGHGPGLDQGLVVAPGETTSYTIILSARDLDRSFIHAPGANTTFSADDVPDVALAGARLLHFGYPPMLARMYGDGGAQLVALLRRAKALGLTTALDMCMLDPAGPTGQADWPEIIATILPHVDLFLPSVEELLMMLRRDTFDRLVAAAGDDVLLDHVPASVIVELGQQALDMGAAVVGLKAGHRGMYLRTAAVATLERMGSARPADLGAWAGRELWAPCSAAAVAGTTGAGDAAIAGFLHELLRGIGPEATLAAACAVGACNVEAPDAIGGVRSWPETAARVAAGWPRLALTIDEPGWRWDDRHETWVGPRDRVTS
jgi:sugar/nucleoside kinase (ribokinase family)